MLIDFLVGLVLFGVIYLVPGLVFLRRSRIDSATLVITAAGIGYPAMTATLVILGALGALNQLSVALTVVGLIAVGWFFPLPADSLESVDYKELSGPLVTATGFAAFMMFQALRPALFRLNDALAVWAPLAKSIGDTGVLEPEWLPTLIEGAPPSISLVAGSVSLLGGGFAEVHAFIVHPIFSWLFLVAAVLLGGHFGGRLGAWLTLTAMLATPVLQRGMLFHDDLLAASLTAIAVLLAVRAKTTPGWAMAGFVAGGALAVKPLGILAVLLGGVVLIAQLPAARAWLGAAAGWLVGLPFYLWNVFRFGNPVHPLLPGIFNEPEEIRIVFEDAAAAVQSQNRAQFGDLGGLTLVLVGFGLVALIVRAARKQAEPSERRLAIALVAALAAFAASWQITGYAARHVIQVLPLAAAAGLGALLSLAGRAGHRYQQRIVAGSLIALVVLSGVTALRDFSESGNQPEIAQTAVYTVMHGKWRDVNVALSPPADEFEIFGSVAEMWDLLALLPSEPRIFAFDHRRYYVSQEILTGGDIEALQVYAATDAEGRHAALLELGVGYVVDRRARGLRHPLFDLGPWEDTRQRPDLYRELFRGGGFRLFEVLDGDE